MKHDDDAGDIRKLLGIMAALRDPRSGCPWDLEQSFATIAPYTIEEAYEVADAIERDDLAELADELGDLLLQVVYHSRLAEEAGAFAFADVTHRICDKMIRRHPHVFGGGPGVSSAAAQTDAWEALKRAERVSEADDSLLDGITVGLPGLTRAVKLGRRAARAGFDWPDAAGPRAKVDEELAELDEAMGGGARERIEAELGDVLFALSNLCRHLDIDPEQCVRGSNARFERRFRDVETRVRASGRGFDGHTPEELESYWQEAKKSEG